MKRAVERFNALPPEEQARHQELQSFSFAYGNLAMTTNHKPTRDAFRTMAIRRGWTEAEFDAWALELEWW